LKCSIGEQGKVGQKDRCAGWQGESIDLVVVSDKDTAALAVN
jgi:hypothetical protein